MKITKKVLGVVLALAMLVNIFAMFSFAAAPESAVDMTMRVDKESYKPGDIVEVTLSVKTEPCVGNLLLGGSYAIGYDSTKIEMTTTATGEDLMNNHGFVPLQAAEVFDNANSTVMFTEAASQLGDTVDVRYNWDSFLIFQIVDDGMTSYNADNGADIFKYNMKIADDCPDGEYVIGYNETSYQNYNAILTDVANGGVGYYDDYSYGTTANYTFGTATIKVSSAAAGPKVAKKAAQAKFAYDQTNPDTVEDAFKLRIKSVITAADWDNYFASTEDTAATTNKITAVGMVAFPDRTGIEYNADTAKEAALAAISSPNRQGQDQSGVYKAASTDYIQKETATSDAYFGAIINTSHTACQEDIKYVGFVQYLDSTGTSQIIFYETVGVATVYSNYQAHVDNFRAGNWSAN